ncbi:MAG: Spo0B domain-containing protein [Eubacteriales bacterium]
MSDINKTLLIEQLDCFQIQRHDFLNNFQVIRGYLQLNMPDKAIKYMDEAISTLVSQQEISAIHAGWIKAILLGFLFGLRLKGIEAKVNIPYNFKEENLLFDGEMEEYTGEFHRYTNECVESSEVTNPECYMGKIELRAEQNGFTCVYHLAKEDKIVFEKIFSTD